MIYYPILKSKENEFLALSELKDESKPKVIPLIELLPETEENTVAKLSKYWNFEGNKVLIDFSLFFDEETEFDAVKEILTALLSNSVNVVPVIEFDSPDDYMDIIEEFLRETDGELCIRIKGKFLRPKLLNGRIENYIERFDLDKDEVILLFDLGNADENNFEHLSDLAIDGIEAIADADEYSDIVIASGSFPENLGEIRANTVQLLQRYEWSIWEKVTSGIECNVSYSDYGIKSPIYNPVTTRFEPSSSLKYTTEDQYLIYRGIKPSKHAKGGGQYHDHCSALIKNRLYDGASFSWGDNEIKECAGRTKNPGNAGTWVKISHNHHFEKILDLL